MDLEDLNEDDRILLELLERIESRNRELTQQVAKKQSLPAQNVAGKWVSSATMSIPWQEATTSAHATIIKSNDTRLESVIAPARDMGVDSISPYATTMVITDTLPFYNAGDIG